MLTVLVKRLHNTTGKAFAPLPQVLKFSRMLSKEKTFLIALLLYTGTLQAQQNTAGGFIWGLEAGFDSQLTGIQPLGNGEPDQVKVTAKRRAPGWRGGVFGRWQLWSGLALQTGLSVSDLHADIQFDEQVTDRFRFTDLEAPLHFVLTNPNGRFPLRGSLLLGARIGWNLAPQHSEYLQLLRERLALDIGLGVEIDMKKWRFQPEVVYSHGLNNIHDVVNARYDQVIGRIVRDRLTLRVLVWLER